MHNDIAKSLLAAYTLRAAKEPVRVAALLPQLWDPTLGRRDLATAVQAMALYARLRCTAGDCGAAGPVLDAALQLCQQAANAELSLLCLGVQAHVHGLAGQPAAALDVVTAIVNDPHYRKWPLGSKCSLFSDLALAHLLAGAHDAALVALGWAEQLAQDLDNPIEAAQALHAPRLQLHLLLALWSLPPFAQRLAPVVAGGEAAVAHARWLALAAADLEWLQAQPVTALGEHARWLPIQQAVVQALRQRRAGLLQPHCRRCLLPRWPGAGAEGVPARRARYWLAAALLALGKTNLAGELLAGPRSGLQTGPQTGLQTGLQTSLLPSAGDPGADALLQPEFTYLHSQVLHGRDQASASLAAYQGYIRQAVARQQATHPLAAQRLQALACAPEKAEAATDAAGPAYLQAAMRLMRSTQGCFLSVPEVAQRVGASERRLRKAFRAGLGESPKQFQVGARLDQARQLLQAAKPGVVSLPEVMEQLGFSHAGRFSKLYRARFGVSPAAALASAARRASPGGRPSGSPSPKLPSTN